MTTGTHDTLVGLLREARRILIFTGAGISTGSGIPDFRGPKGVWTRRQPVYYQDFMSSEEARVEYWEGKAENWGDFRNAKPNLVHRAVADLEQAGRVEMVVTQNIDGLHSAAGTSAERLIEIHGTNSAIECQTCGWRDEPDRHFETFRKERQCPRCSCGGFLKPATISFGQSLKDDDIRRAFAAAESADLAVSLGSTLLVQPAALIPLETARRGVPYVIINRGETGQDDLPVVTLRLEGDVGELFPPAVREALEG